MQHLIFGHTPIGGVNDKMGIAAHIAKIGLEAHPAIATGSHAEQPVIAFYEGLTSEEEQMIKSVLEQYNVKPNSGFKPWEFARLDEDRITIRRFGDWDRLDPEFKNTIDEAVEFLKSYYSDNSHQ